MDCRSKHTHAHTHALTHHKPPRVEENLVTQFAAGALHYVHCPFLSTSMIHDMQEVEVVEWTCLILDYRGKDSVFHPGI